MTSDSATSLDRPDKRIETVAGFVSETHPAFFLQFWPWTDQPRGHVVFLPAFAEEMNRCRSLVAEQARQFARDGLSCSILDFYGTGESQGDLADASLTIWHRNIDALVEQLLFRQRCPVYLWGCRLGGLIALDYISEKPAVSDRLLLWQPVPSGSAFVTQLLRQRSAALMQKGEKPDSTAEVKRQLAEGQEFEVAGYKVSGEIMTAIDQLNVASVLQESKLADTMTVYWLEHIAEEGDEPGARTKRVIGELESAGAKVDVKTFTGDPVWQLNKRATCDDLLTKTRELRL